MSNQIVDKHALGQLVAAARLGDITVAVDAHVHVDVLQDAARQAGVQLRS